MAWKQVFVFIATLLFIDAALCGRKVTTAREANLEFFDEFRDEFKELRSVWTGDDYCTWQGITCDANGDVHINLRGFGLNGEMPDVDDDWGYLASVVEIDLSDNLGLHDDLEKDWRYLSNLRKLNLSYTSIRGEIPDKWGKGEMRSLEELYLHNTAICKSFPEWKGKNLPNLRVVDLSNNHIYGSLKSEWGSLTSLESVNFAGNHICGCVPSSWQSNAVLMNAVSGLPVASSTCKQTNRCDQKKYCPKSPNLDGDVTPTDPTSTSTSTTTTTTSTSTPNGATTDTLAFLRAIAAAFPQQLSAWTGDDYCAWSGVSCDASGDVTVDLSNHGLDGTLPDIRGFDGANVRVVRLNLSNNNGITGNFRDSWAALKLLRVLDLSQTSLYGDIPSSWNGMVSLTEVYIHDTKACRSLPNWALPLLQVVDLSNNNLKGVLVSSWASMTSLRSVNIAGNAFCGCMPSNWARNTVLVDAANAANSALTSTTCWTNQCTSSNFVC